MTRLFQKRITRAILPLLAVLFLFSCQKDLDYVNIDNVVQPADLTTKVTSSVSGFVTDENNAPVMGASVVAGGSNTTTDKYGYFVIKNILVVKNAAVVTVSQPGYFKGIKTYIAADNKSAFFRIKLIPKINAGTIDAAAGGNVTLSNGLVVALPGNGVVNAGTGAAYTGQVNVAAHWIDPVASDLNESMPGDLRGIGTDGSLKLLTTYGMAAVELTGSGGELLQIAAGKKATLTLTIPASILATAPSTIPLWSFDEAKGLWKQEGEATKTGNKYIGEVSHFSFWNCDVPANYVQFNCTVKDNAGAPIANAWVTITNQGNGVTTSGTTDASGYVGGAVPDNAQLTLKVYVGYNCGAPVYTQNFVTANVNISLGDLIMPVSSNIATVTGTVTDCSNNPVTNGRIVIQSDGWYYSVYAVSNTGTFSFPRLLCNGNSTINVIAEDLTANQQSSPVTVNLVAGANPIGNLQACGISTQEFITYSIDGGTTSSQLLMPGDSIMHTGNGSTSVSEIYGYRPGGNNTASLSFSNTGIAVGSVQALNSFYSTGMVGQGVTTGTVNITEYGSVGQFIAGTVTGTVVTTTPTTYNIVCSFRVRRNF